MILILAVGLVLGAATSLRADPADDQFAVAAGHYDRGRWKLAGDEYRRFLQTFPNDRRAGEAAFFLAEATLQLGDFAEARRSFAAYLAREPGGKFVRAARFRLGEAAYLAGDFKTAKHDLSQFLEKYPGDRLGAFVLPYLGDIALAENDPTAALGRFDEALKRYPEGRLCNDCRLGMGKSLLRLGRPKESLAPLDAVLAAKSAGELAEQALAARVEAASLLKDDAAVDRDAARFQKEFAKSPLLDDVQRRLARSLVERRRFADAVALLQPLVAAAQTEHSTPRDIENRYLLGMCQEGLGRTQDALASFAPVVAHAQGAMKADALWHSARLDETLKRSADAVALYRRLADEFPRYANRDAVLYHWAWAVKDQGRDAEADRLFARLRREYPQSRFHSDAVCHLADRAFGANDLATADALIDEALASSPDARVREYAMYLRGRIALAKADWPRAKETFDAILKEFPESKRRPFCQYGAAEACYRQGDLDAARDRLEPLARTRGDRHAAWAAMVPLRLAQIAARQERWDDAHAIASKIATDYPNFAQQYEVDYLLGRCLANRAEFDAARKAYTSVIRSPAGAKTETAARAQWMIGETYFHQKQYSKALREYLRLEILYGYPDWQAAALLEAGKCHEQLNEPAQAVELYRRIVKDYAKTLFAKQAAKRLAAVEKKTT